MAISRWTWVGQYQNVSILDFIGAKGDVGGSNYWSYKKCKAPVKMSTKQINNWFFTGLLPYQDYMYTVCQHKQI